MPTRRDLILRRQEQQNKKADTKPRYRAVLCAADGSRTTGSVWANEDYKLVYFQFFGSGGVGVARCQKIEPQLGLGVYVGKTDDNLEWQVLEDDPLLRRTATDPRGYQSVAARDFEPGGRLQLWLYTKLIVPLATYDTPGTLQVNIVAGDYPYLGTRKTFAGQVGYDLTSHVPGGGLTRYVGLYLDSANTLQAVDGATSAIGSTPAEPTWPAGAFRLSVVQLDNGQTSISFADDIFDRRMVWSDESSSSGWPFDHIVTVSTTNTFADFASIQDAIDSVAAGQVVTVLLDRETFTENLVINSKSIYIFAPILGSPKLGMTTVISGTVTVSTSTGNAICFIEGCSITGLVSADTGVTANSITVFLSRCSLVSVASRRIAQDGRTALYIDNSYVSYTGGNVISGTVVSSPTYIRNSLIEGNIAVNGSALSIDAASWPNGYTVTSGTIDVLDYAESGGVWLNDEGSVIKSKFATIPDAITAAAGSGGDIIEVGPDTYVAPNIADGITVDEPLSIVGLSQVETIITRADNTSTTMAITDTPITLRNLTIRHTGAGAGSSNCLKNNQAGLVLENVYLQKTSGAAGNAIGLSQAAGDSLLVNCKVNVTPGTILNYAIYLHTAGSTCVLEGGEVLAGQLVTAHASAVIELRGVKLASGVTIDVSGGGTVKGWYVDAYNRIVRIKPIGIHNARLTLETGVPVSTSDQTAKTTIYATPYKGNTIEVFNGQGWVEAPFTELSLSLSGFTADKNSDLWIYDNAGTLALERTEWTNDTTRATALAVQDGRYVKSGATTRLYLGTFRTTGTTGQCEDSQLKRFVWNYYNRVRQSLRLTYSATHTYNTATWRPFNNSQANSQVAFLSGVQEDDLYFSMWAALNRINATDGVPLIAMGLNTTSAASSRSTGITVQQYLEVWTHLAQRCGLGYNYICGLEYSQVGATAATFYEMQLEGIING